jgi:hypothetical protein
VWNYSILALLVPPQRSQALLRGMVLFVIESKTGKDVSILGDASENEVLFRLNTKFRVSEVSRDTYGRPVITMEEITDERERIPDLMSEAVITENADSQSSIPIPKTQHSQDNNPLW